jgi:hypothetical protein
MRAQHTPGPRFALAGQVVTNWRQARRIQLDAMRTGRDWLVPQARNVAILLRRAAIAKATGSAA